MEWLLYLYVFGGAVALILGLVAHRWFWIRKEKTYFLQHGIPVEGHLIAQRRLKTPNSEVTNYDYYLTYQYEYQEEVYLREEQVKKKDYLSYQKGAKVCVYCIPTNPTRARLADWQGLPFFWIDD